VRTERGLTQEQLADAAGLHLTHISKIERCLCEPGARTVAKLAQGLRISAGPLFDGIDGGELESVGALIPSEAHRSAASSA
jgi:transcriptional regulator with XRE-family HTH domain